MEIPPDAVEWRALTPEARITLKVNYPHRPVSVAEARAAVAWVRYRRRLLTVPTIVLLVAGAGFLGWALAADPFDPSAHRRLLILVGALGLVIGVILAAVRMTPGMEVTHLASAIADLVPPAPAALEVRWRHGRFLRLAGVSFFGAGAVLLLGFLWYTGVRHGVLLTSAVVFTVMLGRIAYRWPWPIDSPAARVATLDDHGVTVHPLALTVPWSEIDQVRFSSSGAGLCVAWVLVDPAATVAATHVSPFQRRRLARWLAGNNGRVTLSAGRMRESVEAVYRASAAYVAATQAALPASGRKVP